MNKSNAKNSGDSDLANAAGGISEVRSQRPWPLIFLGVAACGFVLVMQSNVLGPSNETRSDKKVYSAAADSFERMPVLSRQTALLEPPGVAKPLYLFAVTVGRSPREGVAVLGPAEASSRTYLAGALLENGAR